MRRPTTHEEAEQINDRFAREHDINAYYQSSGFLVRAIEQRRLNIIRSMMSSRPGERILEVGCGGGHVLQLFRGAKLTGVDVSGEMLAKAEKNLRGYDATLLKGNIAELGLESDSFDGVVCTEVLEHVMDPEAILEQIQRLVRPGGRVVITFPNDNLINGLKGVIRKSGLTAIPPFKRINWGGDHYHFHIWRVPEMRALLAKYFVIGEEDFAPAWPLPIRCCFLCKKRPH